MTCRRDAEGGVMDAKRTAGVDASPAHSKSEYKRRVAMGDPNVTPPAGVTAAPVQKPVAWIEVNKELERIIKPDIISRHAILDQLRILVRKVATAGVEEDQRG